MSTAPVCPICNSSRLCDRPCSFKQQQAAGNGDGTVASSPAPAPKGDAGVALRDESVAPEEPWDEVVADGLLDHVARIERLEAQVAMLLGERRALTSTERSRLHRERKKARNGAQ